MAALAGAYPGQSRRTCWTTGRTRRPGPWRAEFGYRYIHRADWPAGKKAGNLRYAFGRTSAELFVIFDADFAPRPDFLAETLPYLDDPRIAIVQTPQFFRSHPGQTWIERAAGPIQEIFYRAVQVARNRLDAAVCCGTSAVYRRRALEPFGRPDADPVRRGRAHRAGRAAGRLVGELPADRAVDRDLPGQPGQLRAPAVPVVLGQRGHRLLLAAVEDPDEPARPGSPTSPGSSTTPTPRCWCSSGR